MLATFAFDVCHDVYLAAREVIDMKIPTLNVEVSGKYQWRPDRMPRLAEYVCDFARAGERALGDGGTGFSLSSSTPGTQEGRQAKACLAGRQACPASTRGAGKVRQAEACPTLALRASRMAMFRVYYLGGADYAAARRHLGISELTWADWSEEIRRLVGRELTRSGVFPPSKYFRESAAEAS